MAKKSKLLGVIPKKASRPKVAIPEAISSLRPSPRSLASGSYQRKLLAFFGPHILLKALRQLAETEDEELTSADRKQIFELYEMAGGKPKGVSVFVNQNNQTANIRTSDKGEAALSFEEITRIAAERRRQRVDGAPVPRAITAAICEPTPDE